MLFFCTPGMGKFRNVVVSWLVFWSNTDFVILDRTLGCEPACLVMCEGRPPYPD